MSTISSLTGIPPVGSATSNSGGGKGQSGTPQQGQLLKAVVVEAKGNNLFVLDIGGKRIPAQTRIPLSVGQTLQLQVASTHPQIELKVISDSSHLFQGKSLTLLGDKIDLQALLLAVKSSPHSSLGSLSTFSRQTLESYFLLSHESLQDKDSGNLLKQLIDRLGLSFEALLAKGNKAGAQNTLKAALLEMTSVFKNAGELAESTNRILNTIELYQLAQLQLEKYDLFIFPLPIPFLEKGYLVIENPKQGEDEEQKSFEQFSLYLTLEGLGNLRIDILQNNEGVYLRFLGGDSDKLQFIKTFSEDLLPNMLNRDILGVSFAVDQVDPASELLKRLLPGGESLVNTQA